MVEKIQKASTLILSDIELHCNCKDLTLEDLNLTHIGLNMNILDKFDLIIYSGKKGDKILKSKFTKTGTIK